MIQLGWPFLSGRPVYIICRCHYLEVIVISVPRFCEYIIQSCVKRVIVCLALFGKGCSSLGQSVTQGMEQMRVIRFKAESCGQFGQIQDLLMSDAACQMLPSLPNELASATPTLRPPPSAQSYLVLEPAGWYAFAISSTTLGKFSLTL